jgi:hypothetical protein
MSSKAPALRGVARRIRHASLFQEPVLQLLLAVDNGTVENATGMSVNSAPEWQPKHAVSAVSLLKIARPRYSWAVRALERPSKNRSIGASSEMSVIS